MIKISSSNTFFSKKVFPVVWFGFLVFFFVATLTNGQAKKEPVFFIGPCLMAGFGFFIMKKLVWDLADEVYDCGDFLLVKNGGQEKRVALSDIMNVSISTNSNPQRITLRLVHPGEIWD